MQCYSMIINNLMIQVEIALKILKVKETRKPKKSKEKLFSSTFNSSIEKKVFVSV